MTIGLVSIIVPVYNAEDFLCSSVGSVLCQSYDNIELLLINDGSTDSSESICTNYAGSDSRVKVISQKNSGPAAARNTGLKHVAGEYVLFLDADDYIFPNAIERLVTTFKLHQADMVMCNFSKRVGDAEIIQPVSFTPENEPFEGNFKQLTSSDLVEFVRHFLKFPSNHLISYCWARLYKSSTFRENNIASYEDMCLFEDFALNLEYISLAKNVIFLNEPLYVYVMHDSHISASMAIVNSDSLLHDMGVFREKAGEFLRLKCNSMSSTTHFEQEIGHALIHYVIIFLVRSCRQINDRNKQQIHAEIEKLVQAPIVRESLRHYTPQPGNSRMVPLLMKFKLVGLLMSLCRYKGRKRYGKL